MALLVTEQGLICASMVQAKEGDDWFINDRLQYQLAVVSKVILPDPDNVTNGLWHWVHQDDEASMPVE
tara:strand:- start:420 stop:623 length:204 start_codon:yes stop_codon:yes gene_type:complete